MILPLVEDLKMAEGVGNAPTSATPILFSGQAQPACICLPSVKLAARVGLAPTPCGLTNRPATLTPPGNKMALPAGFPPASFRLEGGCLMCSTTAAFLNGQRGRTCTCDRSVPGRVCWLLHYALNGEPEGSCTLVAVRKDLPADNGALC
jgi:hypothetical protein